MQGWYQNNITNFEGCKIHITTSQFSLGQIMKEPALILINSVSRIDLIFKCQANLLIYSGVPLSFHSNFCQQIVFAKFNLTIFYYPPYMWLVWHYQQANTDLAKQAIELFDWKRSLSYLGMNKQVSVFNETIMNTFEIFVSHETITCNDKDPFCMNEQIKKFIAKKTFSINAWSEEC